MLLEAATPVILLALACKHDQDNKTVTLASSSAIICQLQASAATPIVADSLEDAIRNDLSCIPEVLDVTFERENGEVLVWIAVNDPVKDVRYRIYDKQAGIIQAFAEVDINFNFVHAE